MTIRKTITPTHANSKISRDFYHPQACFTITMAIRLGVNRLLTGILAVVIAILTAQTTRAQDAAGIEQAAANKVIVIPVRSPIDKPALYILRRGLKQAITEQANTVVLDMNTPGGRLDVTLDMMKALDRFPGKTITYVNDEATSAGAIIASVTDEIHFAPKATIGAAEAIMGTGQDIGEGMKRKLNSYMGSKIRALAGDRPMRADVIRAMMEPDFEFKIGEVMLKPEGELLSLTDKEAMTPYGDPPQPLLGAGIAKDVGTLLDQLHGKGNYTVQRLELTWSENLAQYITAISSILIALGILGLFIEFKTPGFGIFGVSGIILLTLVFFGHSIAGLSGSEPILIMLLGLVLIAVEIFFFPGTIVPALTGALMILGSLVWAMLDIWPHQPISLSSDMLLQPLFNVTLGVIGAIVLFIALLRFLPSGGIWGKMVLQTAVGGEPAGIRALHSSSNDEPPSLIGKSGKAVTDLFPSGQVEIDGKRYDAHLPVGSADAGTEITVTGTTGFGLNVEVKS